MKYILIFEDFIIEQVETDSMLTSKSYNIEDMKKKMKEYETQKNKIRTVFLNDKLKDSEIPNQLKDLLKNKDPNKFVFSNEFSQMEADVCNISRQIRQKENYIKSLPTKPEVETSPLNPQSKEINKMLVSRTKNEQQDFQKEISSLKEMLLKKEEVKNKFISDFEKKISNLKKEVSSIK